MSTSKIAASPDCERFLIKVGTWYSLHDFVERLGENDVGQPSCLAERRRRCIVRNAGHEGRDEMRTKECEKHDDEDDGGAKARGWLAAVARAECSG